MLLTDFPAEILDHIASALDLPIDLRNLGSTCSQLHRLVHPYHTQFRVIRTPDYLAHLAAFGQRPLPCEEYPHSGDTVRRALWARAL